MSVVRTKKPTSDCIYAAGLCLARWYFGFPADIVDVGRPAGFGHGALGSTRREGGVLVIGASIAPRDWPDGSGLQGAALAWQTRCEGVLAETELIILASGFRAPILQRDRQGIGRWRRRRASDYERARTLADRLAGDPALTLELAFVRARALLGSPSAERAVLWLSRELAKHGRLDGDRIHEICADYTCGMGPARAAWSQSWPPSLEQLRDFHFPYSDIDEDELIDRTYQAYEALETAMG